MSTFPFMFRRRTGEDKPCDTLGVVNLKVKVEDETSIRFFIDAETLLIDWGDGESTYQTSHCYSQSGEYIIRIIGSAINTLDVSRCYVLDLNVNGCPWLESLNCSGNMLRTLDVSGCRWLMVLDCSLNNLHELQFGEHAFLKILDCHMNLLKDLRLSGCGGLLYLYAGLNEMRNLDLGCCPEIRCVDIGNNCFTAGGLNRFFDSLPFAPEGMSSRVMCDLNQGYGPNCDMDLLRRKGWCPV